MLINLKSQSDLSGFYVVFNGSTNNESRGIFGISHLMEHLICKNYQHLRKEFEKEGIDWNAYTSTNEVVFYFTGLDRFISTKRSELVELITDFRVTKEQFENEKKIILQEYNNTFSDQTSNHILNLNRKLYKSYEAIGLREDLERISYMDCLNFFEKQFTSPSKIINVSKTPFKMDIDFSENKFDKLFEFGPYKDVILEPKRNYGDKVSLTLVSKLANSDFNYISFINNMLSMGLSSPLYTEIREKQGLVYNIKCSQSRMNRQGVTIINTETSKKNADRVFDTIKNILDSPSKFLTQKRFELIKNAYKIRYEKEKINRYSNISEWITPDDWSVKNILGTITYDKIMEVFDEYFKFDSFYLSNDDKEFS